MRIHHEDIPDTTNYIESHRSIRLEDKTASFDNYLRHISLFVDVTPRTRILEIGTGTGWFPVLCKLKGLSCKGLEISPQLIDHAKNLGAQNGVEPDIELGNIEDVAIPDENYDVVVAMSVFEHVEDWRRGLEEVYRILKPGGILVFESTNKFSFTSGEYNFPLYGWLPDRWRYRLRIAKQGPDIMKLGIDFNQFRYPQLRRAFRRVGFSRIADRLQITDLDHPEKTAWKRALARAARRFPPLRWAILAFVPTTNFVCVK